MGIQTTIIVVLLVLLVALAIITLKTRRVYRVIAATQIANAAAAKKATPSNAKYVLTESDRLVAQERERIYQDLHDDLGAKLLEMIYRAPTPQVADSARALLQDLRDVVTRSRGTPGTVNDVLTDIEREARNRLGASGHDLDWEIVVDLPDTELNQGQSLHLHRIIREALSNVVQHAHASCAKVRIGLRGSLLHLEVSDDGIGLNQNQDQRGPGVGRQGMQARAAQLDGEINWTQASIGGTKVVLSFPLSETARP